MSLSGLSKVHFLEQMCPEVLSSLSTAQYNPGGLIGQWPTKPHFAWPFVHVEFDQLLYLSMLIN